MMPRSARIRRYARERTRGFSSHPVVLACARTTLFSGTKMAEGVGFEPTEACTSPVFKTGALNQTRPPLRIGATGKLNSRSRFSRSKALGVEGFSFTPLPRRRAPRGKPPLGRAPPVHPVHPVHYVHYVHYVHQRASLADSGEQFSRGREDQTTTARFRVKGNPGWLRHDTPYQRGTMSLGEFFPSG